MENQKEKLKEWYRQIKQGQKLRETLILLKTELKEEKAKRSFAYLVGGGFTPLLRLLENGDPKIRKNAAAILGMQESEDLLAPLWDAYLREETRFVRPEYLKAISCLDYTPLIGDMQSRLRQLENEEQLPEEKKHAGEEAGELRRLIYAKRQNRGHTFAGFIGEQEMVLVTNRCQREVTRALLPPCSQVRMLGGGLRIKTERLNEILAIRTWSELLFPLQTKDTLSGSWEEIAEGILAGGLLEWLDGCHRGSGPYPFRLELKLSDEEKRRGDAIRRLAAFLEEKSRGRLINSVGDYEFELRLIPKKDGTWLGMARLCTLEDRRFAYRREAISSSIAPVNAALAMELARPWLKEHARVLDPFCGVGTMLVERGYAVHADTLYGVDLSAEAIEKARANTAVTAMPAHYINRNYFSFSHEYAFDEVVTDMPLCTRAMGREELRAVYRRFFDHSLNLLREKGLLVLYTMEKKWVKEEIDARASLRLLKEAVINEKKGYAVMIIGKNME